MNRSVRLRVRIRKPLHRHRLRDVYGRTNQARVDDQTSYARDDGS
jgi:hypothetical protein